MRELFLPFHWFRPLVFHWGISMGPGVPYAPHRPFVFAPFLPVCPLAALHRRRHLFPCRCRTLFSTTMAGKSQILPVDAWACSSVTKRKLEELVRDGLL
jgi:hypothetical protein